jgi:hypothetical protein
VSQLQISSVDSALHLFLGGSGPPIAFLSLSKSSISFGIEGNALKSKNVLCCNDYPYASENCLSSDNI